MQTVPETPLTNMSVSYTHLDGIISGVIATSALCKADGSTIFRFGIDLGMIRNRQSFKHTANAGVIRR